MSSIVIRVTASVDRNLDTAYEPIVEAASRAAKKVQENMRRANHTIVSEMFRANKEGAKAFELLTKASKTAADSVRTTLGGAVGGGGRGGGTSVVSDIERAARRAAAAQERAERDGVRAAERAEREKQRIREQAEKNNHNIRMRHFREQQREEERIAKQKAREERAAERKKASYDSMSSEEKFRRLERLAGISQGPRAKVSESSESLLAQAREAQERFNSARDRFSVRDWESEGALKRANTSVNRAARIRSGMRVAGAVGGIVGSAAAFGGRMAFDLARDVGVQTDYGQLTAQNFAVQKNARDLVNSAYMPGKAGAAGMRQDPAAIIAEGRAVGKESGYSTGSAIEALQKFTAKTGDLESGRAILADMAKFSRATGTELEDMVDAAADVSNALGDVANKPAIMKDVMRSIIAQGKEGAVEIKDLATQMAKLGAAATQVSGDPSKAVTTMGALTQMARAKGGASSATMAATSVGSFMATFTKAARVNAFKANGIELREKDGLLRDPRAIITDVLKATGGDANKIAKMFSDQGAQRVMRGWTTTYNQAGGGEKGLAAVNAELDKLMLSTSKMTEIEDSHRAAMAEAEVKVQLVNNAFSDMADKINKDLGPAFAHLVPDIEKFAVKVAEFAGWITGSSEKGGAKDAREAEGRILNATAKVKNGETLTPKEAEQLVADRATVTARLSKDAKTIDSDRNFVRSMDEFHANRKATEKHPITGGMNKWYNGIESGIQDFVGLSDKEAEARARVSEVDRMSDTLRQADTQIGRGSEADAFGEAVVRKLASQQLKVVVVNQAGGPSPSVDNTGRTPSK